MPRFGILSSLACKYAPSRKSTTAILREPYEVLANASIETQSRVRANIPLAASMSEKVLGIFRGLRTGALPPDFLARIEPKTWGVVYPIIRNAEQSYKRVMSVSHDIIESAQAMGIRSGTEKSADLHVFLANVKKILLFNDKALGYTSAKSPEEIRALITKFIDGDDAVLGSFLMEHRMREMMPDDYATYRNLFKVILPRLSDRDIAMGGRIARQMNSIRALGKANMTDYLRNVRKMSEDEIQEHLLKMFGEDLDAYAPLMRDAMKAVVPDHDARWLIPGHESMYTFEREIFDTVYGVREAEAAWGDEIVSLAKSISTRGKAADGTPAPWSYTFKHADSLNLPDTPFSSPDDAIRALFDIVSPPPSGSPDQLKLWDDQLAEARRSLHRIANPPHGTQIAAIVQVPNEIRVRFYKKRILSPVPYNADIVGTFAAYSSAAAKFATFQPILPAVSEVVKAASLTNPVTARAMTFWVSDIVGNSLRNNREILHGIGRVQSLIYASTLGINPSPALGNLIGQPLFTLAEFGPRTTLLALRALMNREGRWFRTHQMLEELMVGFESRPAGSATEFTPGKGTTHLLGTAINEFRAAETGREAFSRMTRLGVSATDVFAATENFMHKLNFLAGVFNHLENKKIFQPGMGREAMDAALEVYRRQGGTNAMLDAGNSGIAKGAFLFGRLNEPMFIRAIKNVPGGGAATMFSNYPIQAMSRLAQWFHYGIVRRDRAEAAKLMRFMVASTAVAGPFAMLPILREMSADGDDTTASGIKSFLTTWERDYSLFGLIGHAIKTTTGEYETVDMASKVTLGPSLHEPFGPLSNIFGGPAVQLTKTGYNAAFGNAEERSAAREKFIGGTLEHAFSGRGNTSKPVGDFTLLFIPNGVFAAKALNAAHVMFVNGQVRTDSQGRMLDRTTGSREIIRFFGRPLTEVLSAAENRIGNAEAEHHTAQAALLKRAYVDGDMTRVGKILGEFPDLVDSLDPKDLQYTIQSRSLVPVARAHLRSSPTVAAAHLRRVANLLASGNVSGAQATALWQTYAVLMTRAKRGDFRGVRT